MEMLVRECNLRLDLVGLRGLGRRSYSKINIV